MAKGDQKRYQSSLDSSSALTRNIASQAMSKINATNDLAARNYRESSQKQMGDYDTIMSGYKNFQFDPKIREGYSNLAGYQSSTRPQFAEQARTGGLSGLDTESLRRHSASAARGAYGNATDEMRRAGINNPAAYARIARQKASDINTAVGGAEGDIAQLRQSGKQFGLSGLEHLDETDATMRAAGLAGLSDLDRSELAKLSQMSSLYGTSPGMVSTFGNQVLGSNSQVLGGAELQRGISDDYLRQLLGKNQIPSDWSQGLGKIGSILNLAGSIPGIGAAFGGGR